MQGLVKGGERVGREAKIRINVSTYLSAQDNCFLNIPELFTCGPGAVRYVCVCALVLCT